MEDDMWLPILLLALAVCFFNTEASYRYDCTVLKIDKACTHIQQEYKEK